MTTQNCSLPIKYFPTVHSCFPAPKQDETSLEMVSRKVTTAVKVVFAFTHDVFGNIYSGIFYTLHTYIFSYITPDYFLCTHWITPFANKEDTPLETAVKIAAFACLFFATIPLDILVGGCSCLSTAIFGDEMEGYPGPRLNLYRTRGPKPDYPVNEGLINSYINNPEKYQRIAHVPAGNGANNCFVISAVRAGLASREFARKLVEKRAELPNVFNFFNALVHKAEKAQESGGDPAPVHSDYAFSMRRDFKDNGQPITDVPQTDEMGSDATVIQYLLNKLMPSRDHYQFQAIEIPFDSLSEATQKALEGDVKADSLSEATQKALRSDIDIGNGERVVKLGRKFWRVQKCPSTPKPMLNLAISVF